MLVWSRKTVGESSHRRKSCQKLEQLAGTDFSQNSSTLYSFTTTTQPTWPHLFTHAMLDFHWLWFTPMQFLFSIGYGLHSCIVCGSHFVDFIYGWMYLSTTSARFITGQGNILHFEGGMNIENQS